jgi:hypothetical protein
MLVVKAPLWMKRICYHSGVLSETENGWAEGDCYSTPYHPSAPPETGGELIQKQPMLVVKAPLWIKRISYHSGVLSETENGWAECLGYDRSILDGSLDQMRISSHHHRQLYI